MSNRKISHMAPTWQRFAQAFTFSRNWDPFPLESHDDARDIAERLPPEADWFTVHDVIDVLVELDRGPLVHARSGPINRTGRYFVGAQRLDIEAAMAMAKRLHGDEWRCLGLLEGLKAGIGSFILTRHNEIIAVKPDDLVL